MTKKCQKGKQISIEGQLRYPQQGRTTQATNQQHPSPDKFNDGRESDETAPCRLAAPKVQGARHAEQVQNNSCDATVLDTLHWRPQHRRPQPK